MLGDLRGGAVLGKPELENQFRNLRFGVRRAEPRSNAEGLYTSQITLNAGEEIRIAISSCPIRLRPEKGTRIKGFASYYEIIPDQNYPGFRIIRNSALGARSFGDFLKDPIYRGEFIRREKDELIIKALNLNFRVESSHNSAPDQILPPDLVAASSKLLDGLQINPQELSLIIAKLEAWVQTSKISKIDDCVASHTTALSMFGPDLTYNTGRFLIDLPHREYASVPLEFTSQAIIVPRQKKRFTPEGKEGKEHSFRQAVWPIPFPIIDILATPPSSSEQLSPFDLTIIVNTDGASLEGFNPNLCGVKFVREESAVRDPELRHRLNLIDHEGRSLPAKSRKLLILDADQILWQGEAASGSEEIVIDQQRTLFLNDLARLKQKCGLQLAIISHNNQEDLNAALVKLEESSLLKRSDFAFICASAEFNWQSKDEITQQMLNRHQLTPREVVFLDDDPRIRTALHASLPDLYVPNVMDLPTNLWATYLEASGVFLFDPSAEISQIRAGSPERARARGELKIATTDYLKKLESKAVIRVNQRSTDILARCESLLGRSNQFNASGLQRTAAELATSTDRIYTLNYSDQVGSEGLVACAFVQMNSEQDAELKNIAVSCRVLHTLEANNLPLIPASLLETVIEDLRTNFPKLESLNCRYQPTARNHLVARTLESFAAERTPLGYNISLQHDIELANARYLELIGKEVIR